MLLFLEKSRMLMCDCIVLKSYDCDVATDAGDDDANCDDYYLFLVNDDYC